jgi:type IV secretory pathway TrbD component
MGNSLPLNDIWVPILMNIPRGIFLDKCLYVYDIVINMWIICCGMILAYIKAVKNPKKRKREILLRVVFKRIIKYEGNSLYAH